MISVEMVDRYLADSAFTWGAELVPLLEANNRILRTTISADRAIPPHDHVQVDGIALFHGAWAGGRSVFNLQASHQPGAEPPVMTSDRSAIRVRPGTAMPLGCDTVVPVDSVKIQDTEVEILCSHHDVSAGSNVHAMGSDHRPGDELLHEGTLLGATELAVAASVGAVQVPVAKAPRVLVISTGGELVSPEEPVAPHQLRRTNAVALQSLFENWGTVFLQHLAVGDDEGVLLDALQSRLGEFDLVVSTGGVSRGELDLVPRVWDRCGVTRTISGVQQLPNSEFMFGTKNSTLLFALSGYPMSSIIGMRRFIWPMMDRMSGREMEKPRQMRSAAILKGEPGLTRFIPIKWQSNMLWPKEIDNPRTHSALVETNGFLEVPPDNKLFERETYFAFHAWRRA